MKINFNHNGKRSTLTIDDKLISIWSLTLFQPVSKEALLKTLRGFISEAIKTHQRFNVTLTKRVEHLLLDEIGKSLNGADRFELQMTD